MDAFKPAQLAPFRNAGPSERPSRHGHYVRRGISAEGGRTRITRKYRDAGRDEQARLAEAMEDIAKIRTVRVRGV
jgi:hypothetical protein